MLAVEHHAPARLVRGEARNVRENSLTPDASRLTSLHFFMWRVLATKSAELIPLQSIRIIFLIFPCRIVPLLASRTGQINDVTHFLFVRRGS
jgi:hypothetical protein